MDIFKSRRFSRARRRRVSAVFTVLALLAGLVLTTSTSGATTVADTFELDGNPQESASTGDDWESLMDGGDADSAEAKTAIPIFDGADSPTDTTYFTGGGSKDVRDINLWAHSGTDVAPDKNEIVNAAAAAYFVPDELTDTDLLPDLVINFHADRFSNDGDAAAGFWFFKNQITLNDNGGFDGVHEVGDVLVVSDFNEGEGVNVVRVFTWNGTGLIEAPLPGSGPVDCQALEHNPYVCATTNRSNQDDVSSVWPYTPKGNVGFPNRYPDFTFLEGGINISAVLPTSEECFASFLAETRSSTSPTAQLKDFVLGEFPVCAPSTTLSASPTTDAPEIALVGDDVTFTFTETNDGNVPLTGVDVVTDNAACNAAMTPEPVTLAAGGGVQVFSCTITTGATPAVIDIVGTGHGTDTLGRDTTYCTDPDNPPTNTVCDQDEQATARAVTILPSTDIDVSATPTTVREGDEVTFTITETNDGTAPTGFNSYLDLTTVSISTNHTTCDEDLGTYTGDVSPGDDPSINTDDTPDGVLSKDETWTYTCTVDASASGLSLTAIGTGTVLAGTSHARTVTYTAAACTDVAGTTSTVGRFCDADEMDTASVTVINPSTSLLMTASAVITYTFQETNDGDSDLDPPTAGSRVSVLSLEDAGMCNVSGPIYVSGDQASGTGSLILEEDETWVFTCVGSLAGPTADTGTTSKLVTGIGSGVDATNTKVTFCDACELGESHDEQERDRVTVRIENHAQGADPAAQA